MSVFSNADLCCLALAEQNIIIVINPRVSLRNGFSAVPPTKHAPGTACHPPRV